METNLFPFSHVLLARLSQVAATSLLASMWQAGLLAAAVALCLRMMPRITAAARYVAWICVLVACLLLPLASTFANHTGAAGPSLHFDIRWSFAIAGLWAALSVFRGVQLLQSAIRLHRIAKAAMQVTNCATDLLPDLSLGKSRTAILCSSEDVARPSVIGFFSPRVLIPSSLLPKLSNTELEHIVRHEMEHLRRGDDWVNLLQKIALVLFPLNPALLWIERRVCLERELACDDGVLQATKAPKAYASSLVNLAEHSILGRPISLALGAWERRPELARRVQHILRPGAQAMKPAYAAASVVVLVAGVFTGAAGLSRSPHLVSFTDAPNLVAASGDSSGYLSRDSSTAWSAPPFGGAYQPVIFHERAAGGYHATLLKASMPTDPPTHAIDAAKRLKPVTKHRRVVQPRPHEQNVEHSVEQSWMMLTSDSYVSPERLQIVRVVWTVRDNSQRDVRQFSESYAAVPADGGWLVIQI